MFNDLKLMKWFSAFDPVVYDYRLRYMAFITLYKIFAHLNGLNPEDSIVDYETGRTTIEVISSMNDDDIQTVLKSVYKADLPYIREIFDPDDWDLKTLKTIKDDWENKHKEKRVVLVQSDQRFAIPASLFDQFEHKHFDQIKEYAEETLNPIEVSMDENGDLVFD